MIGDKYMKNEEYKKLSIKEFTKAAGRYESNHAGVYEMCKKDYPDILEELDKEPFRDLLDAGCGPAPMISLFMDFSLLSPLEFFVVPKNGDGRNNKPPAMRVRVDCYTKNYLSVYNKVVQAILWKGKVIYGEERKFTRTYEMDVQISYRLHT